MEHGRAQADQRGGDQNDGVTLSDAEQQQAEEGGSPLEDETGAVNVIVWPRVAEAQREPLLGATLLTVYGTWQREGDAQHAVMHLVAAKMIDHSKLLNGLVSRSRNFR